MGKILFYFFIIALSIPHISKVYCFPIKEKEIKREIVSYSLQEKKIKSQKASSNERDSKNQLLNPILFGDGIHDDTPAIQFLLDSEKPMVYLPVPKSHYLISKTLKIHSNQQLKLDPFTVIKLAPKSDCLMITNDDHEKGNENIAVTGGIWDMDNIHQSPNPIRELIGNSVTDTDITRYDPERYLGICMRFVNVRHFDLSSIIFRDPVTFCTQLARIQNFTIDNITFDYHNWNPLPVNMDGIHLDGGCRFGRITNLKGATNDDLVALNADDLGMESPFQGPIEDITIDGIYAEDCHSAVRILSSGSPVQRITIRNVFGTYYVYAVGFTKFFHNRKDAEGYFDSIVLENIHIGKADNIPHKKRLLPLIWFEHGIFVQRVTIRDYHRNEEVSNIASVYIDKEAKVESLLLEDCSIVNHTGKRINFVENHGMVDNIKILNFYGNSTEGGKVIDGNGIIGNKKIEGSSLVGME